MCKALIIDDEETICELLQQVLSHKGISSETATNGREGLTKFCRDQFDLVITDMVMPDMDGNSVARQIRDTENSNTRIIGMSGTAWLLDKKEFDLVLEKPFSINRLLDQIGSIMPSPVNAIAG